ncbi:hypothetical protein [Mucilaginibacter xinganensis]|uniref:Uncharacterized protein n=1 Tax=Mucilaginibacter xinganensis TaxID=1234841 RepID=A0A223P0Y7_9SPHI|nr:hypothetical protein [Mucilaginibacter xinganensis]ASU35604.1 hypothetical protein MuYL_3719 [Mucilaginibacter xinganensis]
MDDNFKLRAAIKSDEELHYCIDNREKYLPETVEAAVDELKIRGVEFSDEELKVIAEDMQARRELAAGGQENINLFKYSDGNNQVEDPAAPAFYSKRAVYVFAILFSVFFASVMLAINVAKVEKTGKALLVVLFGLGYTAFTIVLAQTLNLPTGAGIFLGMIGGYTMNAFFWNNFIGKETLYRLKPVWVPLGVALAILIPILIFIFKYGTL